MTSYGILLSLKGLAVAHMAHMGTSDIILAHLSQYNTGKIIDVAWQDYPTAKVLTWLGPTGIPKKAKRVPIINVNKLKLLFVKVY